MAKRCDEVIALGKRQDSVVTTAQALRLGARPDWLEDQVSAGRWQRLHRGVLATHSGPLDWRTRFRAALLYAGPGSALGGAAAGYLHGFVAKMPRLLDVAVPRERSVRPSAGLRIHRVDRLLDKRAGFAVVECGEAVLDLVAQTRSQDDAVGLLCDAVRAGASPYSVRTAWQRRVRQPHRTLIAELIGEVSAGVESPLERRYVRDVEMRHGLPRAVLQKREVVEGLWIRADGVYDGLGVRRELDGELAHPGGRTNDDVWRDNAVVIATKDITLRYRWYHVVCIPCRTAAQVLAALRSCGWRGTPRPCCSTCPVR